jgi:hypothetical protein
LEERGGRVGSEHEMLADEEGVEARRAKVPKIGVGAESGFGYGEAMLGDLFDQFERCFHAHSKGLQVAIVDADNAGVRSESAIEFGLRVDLDERLHGKFAAQSEEIAQKRIVERRHNQEETIRIVGTGFPNLPGIKDKILAQSGEGHFLACIAKILERAAEEFTFRENGKRGGAGGFQGFGKGRRVEGIANDAAGGRGRLEFGDDVESVARKSGCEIADRRGGFHTVFERGLRQDALAVIDFGSARFEDAVEDGAGVGLSVHWAELVC